MDEHRAIPVRAQADIVLARQTGRDIAKRLGFVGSDLTLIATAISEVARNIVEYAGSGEVVFTQAVQGARRGLTVIARDQGPGIADIERALQDGFTTGAGLGLGLPGTRRLMHDFELVSAPGAGTTITMTRWIR